MSNTTIILAIDCGGTKCEMLAVDAETAEVIREVRHQADRLPPDCRPKQIFGGIGRTPELLNYCLNEALGDMVFDRLLVTSNVTKETLDDMLAEHGMTAANYLTVGETLSALFSENQTWGIAIAAGTGTVGTAWLPSGESLLIDGVGPVVGDWGSAYSIGLDFLRRSFRKQSYQHEPLEEMQRICAHCDAFPGTERSEGERPLVENSRRVAQYIYKYTDRSVTASLARICGECAQQGSELAKEVLLKAGNDLAESVLLAANCLGFATMKRFPVVASGSVLRKNDIVFEAMRRRLATEMPQADVIQAQRPQVCGQIVGMLKKLYPPDGGMFINQFFENYHKFKTKQR